MKEQTRSIGARRGDGGAVRADLWKLEAHIRRLRQRTQQLALLHAENGQAVARLARLESVLEFDRVAAHVRSAIGRTPLALDPIPHLVVSHVLPEDVYEAVIDAVPAPVFFDGRPEEGQELRVPPRRAPASSIVTWTFLHQLVGDVLSGLLVARFAESLDVLVRARFPTLPPIGEWGALARSAGRIVRRIPGSSSGRMPDRTWELINGVLWLARRGDTEQYGSRLQAKEFPFVANSLLAFAGPPEAHAYAVIAADAPPETERYTYEFGIGPAKDARRALTPLLRKTTLT